jgi:hypothetical protein
MRATALVLAITGILLAAVASAPAENSGQQRILPINHKAAHKQQRSLMQLCPGTVHRIKAHRQSAWEAQRQLRMRPTRVSRSGPRSCGYARWVENLWWKRVVKLRAEVRKRVLPQTNDWVTAVRVTQRVYPGTSGWMLYISHREGGYGPWVWYGGRHWSGYHIGNDFLGADTVGGWMQFRFSTFAPYWRGALKDLRARGVILPPIPDHGGPPEYQPWLWPLGQALTAGYMRYYGKDGCHWCL